jgi:hypothetical protein
MAAICAYANSQGTLKLGTWSSLGDCDLVVLDQAAYDLLMAANTALTSAEILYLYTWGMGAILLPWSIAYACKWGLKVIKIM